MYQYCSCTLWDVFKLSLWWKTNSKQKCYKVIAFVNVPFVTDKCLLAGAQNQAHF